jgi:hypothetical protein
MTHNELLAKINSFTCCSGVHEIALRAVVELHKPDVRGNCDICSWVSGGFVVYSVCPTIQAIEKEL